MGAQWRVYPGLPAAAGVARQYVGRLLADDPELAGVAAQALAELFANALMHTASGRPGGVVGVSVDRLAAGVRVEVSDEGGPDTPAVADPGHADHHGRGLMIVNALAARWGVTGDARGRVVWFELDGGCAAPGDEPRTPEEVGR